MVCWSRIVDANVATEHVETIKHDLANVLALLDAISLDKPEAGETIDSILSEAPSTSDLLFRKKEIIVSPMITAGS